MYTSEIVELNMPQPKKFNFFVFVQKYWATGMLKQLFLCLLHIPGLWNWAPCIRTSLYQIHKMNVSRERLWFYIYESEVIKGKS